jgi:hypothetical protein
MTDDRQEKIRTRAHAIWQSEGEPHGRHDAHWAQAESEVDEDAGDDAEAVTPAPAAADEAGNATLPDATPTDPAPAAATPAAKLRK